MSIEDKTCIWYKSSTEEGIMNQPLYCKKCQGIDVSCSFYIPKGKELFEKYLKSKKVTPEGTGEPK